MQPTYLCPVNGQWLPSTIWLTTFILCSTEETRTDLEHCLLNMNYLSLYDI